MGQAFAFSLEPLLTRASELLQAPEGPINSLFAYFSFERGSSWENSFRGAMKHSLENQIEIFPYFRDLARRKRFSIQNLDADNWAESIPWIITPVLKEFDFTGSVPDGKGVFIYSSGTSGKRSKVVLDELSLIRTVAALVKVYTDMGLADTEACHCLFMGYAPNAAHGAASAGTDQLVSLLTPQRSKFFALDFDANGQIKFFKDEAVNYLHDCVSEGSPIRVFGFLHFFCEVLSEYNKKFGKVKFPEKSLVLSGGGWKEFASNYGPSFNIYDFFRDHSSLAASQLRDSYSLAEHPILFVQCENNRFHIPSFSEVIIREPRTLKPLDFQHIGLIQLLTPLISSYPSCSILTTDFGYIERTCACGRPGPILSLAGRAGKNKLANCAIVADSYI